MMALISLRKLLGFTHAARRARSRPEVRLRLEALEQRMALATLTVGPDSNDDFSTIQAAVIAAQSGDMIKVDPGIYVEQVTINNVGHSRNNLKVVGVNQNAIIKAPAVMVDDKAIVEVNGSKNVTIEKFTIQGPGGGPNNSINYGVRVDGGGSAKITNNHITDIRDNPLSGNQNGNAIQIGRQFEGQTGSAVITKNTIDNYQKSGIVVDNTGSSAEIAHNTIIGVGPTAITAQNGIQISRGATAKVRHNQVSENIYTPQTFASTGMLLFQAGEVTVDHNSVFNNDVGIYSIDVNGGVISHNDVFANTFNGIALDTTIGMLVSHNTTNNNGSGNDGDSGIGLYGSENNTIKHNTSNNNNGDGIFVDFGSTGNTLSHNKMKGNTPFDAEDQSVGPGTSNTANTWKKNKGKTSSPPGLVS